ncbi:response regulator [Candidatus Poribacteria bacterium]|nr:response regulator [Candidatus Poribacteria bacterium]
MSDKHRKTILIVDDVPDIRLMMEDYLLDKYEVLTASNGVEALEIIVENRDNIDLVITDIRMPRMDGMSLLKEIKTHYPEIGVMMITAYGEISTAVEAIRNGAYDYITKPLPEPLDALDITIARYFEKHQLEERLRQHERAEMERVRRELEDARQIQRSLLPKKTPKIKGFEITGMSVPAKEVGGDFYDYLLLSDNVGIVLADVSGKSMRAAMVAAMANGMLHAGVKGQSEIWDSPSSILHELNIALRPRLIDWMFTAMSLSIFKAGEKRFQFSNAGLPYPLVKRGEKAWELELNGLPLGAMDYAEYTELNVDLEAGDFVVFYSDGITEATNGTGEMYQMERLLKVLQQAASDLSAQEMAARILQDVALFVGDVEQGDDITLVVVRCDG